MLYLHTIVNAQIKHVDEDTGQIKDNVWEFQHPNFQAGGKSDLDSIKVSFVRLRLNQQAHRLEESSGA